MITAEPLGRALRAALSVRSLEHPVRPRSTYTPRHLACLPLESLGRSGRDPCTRRQCSSGSAPGFRGTAKCETITSHGLPKAHLSAVRSRHDHAASLSLTLSGTPSHSLCHLAATTKVEHGHTDYTNLRPASDLSSQLTRHLTFLSDLDWPEGVIPVVYSPSGHVSRSSRRPTSTHGAHEAHGDRWKFVSHVDSIV